MFAVELLEAMAIVLNAALGGAQLAADERKVAR